MTIIEICSLFCIQAKQSLVEELEKLKAANQDLQDMLVHGVNVIEGLTSLKKKLESQLEESRINTIKKKEEFDALKLVRSWL